MTKKLERATINCEDGDDHEFFVKDLLALVPDIAGACKTCKKPVQKGLCCSFCGRDDGELT
jgi:hypothetical protein